MNRGKDEHNVKLKNHKNSNQKGKLSLILDTKKIKIITDPDNDLISDHHIYVFCPTETWPQHEDCVTMNTSTPSNYL